MRSCFQLERFATECPAQGVCLEYRLQAEALKGQHFPPGGGTPNTVHPDEI